MSDNNALTVIQNAQKNGALVYVNQEHFEASTPLYKQELTTLAFAPDNFHNIQGKYAPKKESVDRIGEAAGIEFVAEHCKVVTESRDDPICGKRAAYVAFAQGRVRMPDGSWRYSTVDSYEFDPVLRAMLDSNVTALTDQTKEKIGKKILEYMKVASQRASTGARVRVIRQLTGMPTAFAQAETQRPMVFSRIVQNTDYILKTPEGRAMATAQALGYDVAALYGKKQQTTIEAGESGDTAPAERNVTPDKTTTVEGVQMAAFEDHGADDLASQAAQGDDCDFDPSDFDRTDDPLRDVTIALEEFLNAHKNVLDKTNKAGTNPYNEAQKELDNKAWSVQSRSDMLNRIKAFVERVNKQGAAA